MSDSIQTPQTAPATETAAPKKGRKLSRCFFAGTDEGLTAAFAAKPASEAATPFRLRSVVADRDISIKAGTVIGYSWSQLPADSAFDGFRSIGLTLSAPLDAAPGSEGRKAAVLSSLTGEEKVVVAATLSDDEFAKLAAARGLTVKPAPAPKAGRKGKKEAEMAAPADDTSSDPTPEEGSESNAA